MLVLWHFKKTSYYIYKHTQMAEFFIFCDRMKVINVVCGIVAIVTLGQPELPTVKAATTFLTNVISQSREQPKLLTAVQITGEQLVHRVLRSIGEYW